MKAITIVQPWATLIVRGEKRIETRSWATAYRGPLLIHASAKFDPYGFDLWQQLRGVLPQVPVSEEFGTLPRGCIIGSCVLDDCLATGSLIFGKSPPSDMERSLGDFTAGRYGFMVSQPREFKIAVAARGMLNIWNAKVTEGLMFALTLAAAIPSVKGPSLSIPSTPANQ